MGVYIKGMELPTNEPLIVKINPDGSVSSTRRNDYRKYSALVVPDHGRLKDADALMVIIKEYIEEYSDVDENGWHNGKWCAMEEAAMVIDSAPTIIEAEGEE